MLSTGWYVGLGCRAPSRPQLYPLRQLMGLPHSPRHDAIAILLLSGLSQSLMSYMRDSGIHTGIFGVSLGTPALIRVI